jgi:hypothetical protein
MNLKQFLLISLMLLSVVKSTAQSQAGLSIGISNNDNHVETLWFQNRFNDLFSVGLQFRYSQIKYRFVDAIAIKDGSTVFGGLVFGFKLKETSAYSLHFNLTSSYRYLSNDERPELAESTHGIELDPNIVLSLKLTNKLTLHAGTMLRTAMQFGDTPILDEQMPSTIVLAALSYHFDKSSLAIRAYTGPMNGATGDTMKYFNQISLGYQYNLGKSASSFSFFNF